MHSSKLRAGDFKIAVEGRCIEWEVFFAGVTRRTRLGVVAPGRFEGAGAVGMVMAYVTAFYDDYRRQGGEFFAYPDFFTFQGGTPTADYGMFDIWPQHKQVEAACGEVSCLDAVTDRGIEVLLVPDGVSAKRDYHPVQQAAAARLIRSCYVYGSLGTVDGADVTVRCRLQPFAEWADAMFDSVEGGQKAKEAWHQACGGGEWLEQAFRRVGLEEALGLL